MSPQRAAALLPFAVAAAAAVVVVVAAVAGADVALVAVVGTSAATVAVAVAAAGESAVAAGLCPLGLEMPDLLVKERQGLSEKFFSLYSCNEADLYI